MAKLIYSLIGTGKIDDLDADKIYVVFLQNRHWVVCVQYCSAQCNYLIDVGKRTVSPYEHLKYGNGTEHNVVSNPSS